MELTKNEKIMKYTALVYALIFIFTATVFFIFLPDTLMKLVNSGADLIFGKGTLPHYPLDENKFWLAMTVSMMAGVTSTSLLIYKDVKKYKIMAIPLSIMKFTSASMGLGFFLFGFILNVPEWTAFANVVIFITDFPLGVLMLILYKRAK